MGSCRGGRSGKGGRERKIRKSGQGVYIKKRGGEEKGGKKSFLF